MRNRLSILPAKVAEEASSAAELSHRAEQMALCDEDAQLVADALPAPRAKQPRTTAAQRRPVAKIRKRHGGRAAR